jgi:hypothetical protein
MGRDRPLFTGVWTVPLLKETAVDLVHAADRRPPDGRVVAVLGERADQEIGVVVALEHAVGELARRREQLGDARHGKGAEERQLERARGVAGSRRRISARYGDSRTRPALRGDGPPRRSTR